MRKLRSWHCPFWRSRPAVRPLARRRVSSKTGSAQVNDKVESVSKSLEETQERTRKNEAAIAEANQKIGQVDQRAAAANDAAATAKTAADGAATKAAAVDKATKRIIYEVTISEDQGNFKLNDAALPDEAKARLDEVVRQLKANPNGAYIEVEGLHRQHRPEGLQRQARAAARRVSEAVPLRGTPDSAAPDQRHQLRPRQAGCAEYDEGRARQEPPRRDQGADLGRLE